MTIRERTEQIERDTLSNFAALSMHSAGRRFPERECDVRTCFQRDRDRIIHCKAFRRLKHKTQVFLAPEGDHYRTRLTHTLEVSQIARTISRALRLNEDLAEAIAMGHDIGHTPFGHAGERALREASDIGFSHYDQSVRVVEILEKNGQGLNLTAEVIDGIRAHTKGPDAVTSEGRVVFFADRIAYMNHDIDDSIRGGILREGDIPKEISQTLGTSHAERIDTLIKSIIDSSSLGEIKMAGEVKKASDKLHEFMYERVYRNPLAKSEEGKAEALVQSLFFYFSARPEELPAEYIRIAEKDGAVRAAVDYIASMSDGFAISEFTRLNVPEGWKLR